MAVEYDYLPSGKYVTLAVIGTISSLMSLYGSSTVMYLVLLKRWKKKNGSNTAATSRRRRSSINEDDGLYHRIVFGLSATDLITTLAILLSPYTNRSDTNLPFAIGNESSCEWSGFFFYFWLGSYVYNAELSLFFLLTVRYNKREEEISRRFEPYIHIVPFLLPLAFNSAAIALDLFNPSLLLGICELAPYPADCVQNDSVECERGSLDDALSWGHLLVTMSAVITGLVSTWLVYWTVRNQTLRNRRYSISGEVNEQQRRRTRAVAWQAVWYTVAFMNGFCVALFISVMNEVYTKDLSDTKAQLSDNGAVYSSVFLVYLFFPLQGFFNWYIYIRPRLIRWKDANPEKSWLWSYRMVLTGDPAPTTRRTSHLTTKPRWQLQLQQSKTGRGQVESGGSSAATTKTRSSSLPSGPNSPTVDNSGLQSPSIKDEGMPGTIKPAVLPSGLQPQTQHVSVAGNGPPSDGREGEADQTEISDTMATVTELGENDDESAVLGSAEQGTTSCQLQLQRAEEGLPAGKILGQPDLRREEKEELP